MTRDRQQLCSKCYSRMKIFYDCDDEYGMNAFFWCPFCDEDRLEEMKDANRKRK